MGLSGGGVENSCRAAGVFKGNQPIVILRQIRQQTAPQGVVLNRFVLLSVC